MTVRVIARVRESNGSTAFLRLVSILVQHRSRLNWYRRPDPDGAGKTADDASPGLEHCDRNRGYIASPRTR
jgi:hypothetical protein